METVTVEQIMREQAEERTQVMDTSNRANSAWVLADMALEHDGSGSQAAAKLLLAMEYGTAFDFRLLLSFDSTNRAHADLVMLGYKSHELWPSKWMDDLGKDGEQIMKCLADKWRKE